MACTAGRQFWETEVLCIKGGGFPSVDGIMDRDASAQFRRSFNIWNLTLGLINPDLIHTKRSDTLSQNDFLLRLQS